MWGTGERCWRPKKSLLRVTRKNSIVFRSPSHWECIVQWSECVYPPKIHISFFLLEDNCFTILCWPLPYISINQPQVYICPLPPEPHLPFPTPSHLSRLSESTGLSWLCHTANSHLLSILHMVMYVLPLKPICCCSFAQFCLTLWGPKDCSPCDGPWEVTRLCGWRLHEWG